MPSVAIRSPAPPRERPALHSISVRAAALLHDRDWLVAQYVGEGRTMQQIADAIGVSETTVLRGLRRHSIDRRGRGVRVRADAKSLAQPKTPGPRQPRPRVHPQLGNRGWLKERYEREGRTVREIAAELEASPASVHQALVHHEIVTRSKVRRAAVVGGKFPKLRDETWLRCRYEAEGLSVGEISVLLGCSSSAVSKALTALGIVRRPPKVKHRFEELWNESWVREHYEAQGLAVTEIARLLGARHDEVSRALARYDVSRRPGRAARR